MATKKPVNQINKKTSARKTDLRQENKLPRKSGQIGHISGVEFIDQILIWILVAVVGLIPLLLRGHVSQFVAPKIAPGLLSTGMYGDLFVYHKWIALIVLSVAALLLTIIKVAVMKDDIRPSYINLPLLGLASLAIAASLFSKFKGLSLFGMYDMREGLITVLCYLTLFLVTANINFKRNYIYQFIAALFVVVLVNDCLGVAWFFGLDLLQNPIVQALVTPDEAGTIATANSELISTLMNRNYLSGLAGALLVFGFTMAIFVNEDRKRIIFGIMSLLSFVILLVSLSSSGVLVVYFLVPIILVFALIRLASDRKKVLLTAFAMVLSGILLLVVFNSHNSIIGQEFTGFLDNREEVHKVVPKVARDWPGKDLGLPKAGWGVGKGRVYIWKETAKLIEKKPFLGYGPGTLAYNFPHNDIAAKANLYSYYGWVTKPHNMYLNVAYSLGIPALLILLFLLARHFCYSIKILITKAYDEDYVFIAALFAFWLAFLMQWLFNDSFIGTSPIFWVLFGVSVSLGGGINYTETEKLNSKP